MWRPVLRVTISITLILIVVASVDRGALASGLARIELIWLVMAFLLIWSTNFVSAGRWSIVIRSLRPVGAHRPSYWRLWSLYWIGQFFNQLLPSGLGGDGVRMWLVRRAGLPTGLAITSVVVDRVVALAAIALLVAIALPFAFDGTGSQTAPIWLWGVVAGCALAIVAVVGLGTLPLPRLLSANPMVRGVRQLGKDLWKLMIRPGYVAATLGASIAVQLLGAAAVYAIAQSLGVGIGLFTCVALMPIVVLATALPISIAGWGVREVAMVAVLGSVGVTEESALLISLLYGAVAVVISLPGGALWLFGRRDDGGILKRSGPDMGPPAANAAEL
ncbi:MAG: flippase-like domain-containing protein [Alphaproteobacteria bacterium]|nr:flippase-like domain-containing protein [Alphaproteobacteria bacterium]